MVEGAKKKKSAKNRSLANQPLAVEMLISPDQQVQLPAQQHLVLLLQPEVPQVQMLIIVANASASAKSCLVTTNPLANKGNRAKVTTTRVTTTITKATNKGTTKVGNRAETKVTTKAEASTAIKVAEATAKAEAARTTKAATDPIPSLLKLVIADPSKGPTPLPATITTTTPRRSANARSKKRSRQPWLACRVGVRKNAKS